MSNNKLLRIAGWCAIGGAVFIVAAFIFSLIAPSIGLIFEILFILMLLVVFYALFVSHRSESKNLSLVGLVLAVVAVLVDLLSLVIPENASFINFWYIFIALAFLVFGYLAYRSSKMPRGLAVVAIIAGVFFLIGGLAGFTGSTTFAGTISLIATLIMAVWLFWLWRVFWSKKLVTT